MHMQKKTVGILLLVIAVISGIAVVYYVFDPSQNTFFPRCPLFALTGLKCPGCGSQRALHQLLHLHLAEAFRYNAMLPIAIPILGLLATAEALKSKFPKIGAFCKNNFFAWTTICILTLWWICRNIFGL